jgi:hypothetical protein
MKKKRIELATEIIARLQIEMNKPRLTESVRNGMEADAEAAAAAAKEPAARFARV